MPRYVDFINNDDCKTIEFKIINMELIGRYFDTNLVYVLTLFRLGFFGLLGATP